LTGWLGRQEYLVYPAITRDCGAHLSPFSARRATAKNVKYTLIGYKSGEKWQLSVPGASKRWAESLVSAKQEYLTQFALSVCRSISPVLDRSQNERRKEE